jgi:pSer/pThr/pTyr-binding forkhead associated (FHA) protein
LIWDAQVSRSHASIEVIDGVWTVLDDGRSTNGTFVNEERVQGRRTLRHLDVIRVGATRLRFHDPSETTDSTTMQWTATQLRRLLAPIVIQEVGWGATVGKVPKGFV